MSQSLISRFAKFSYGSWIGLLIGVITTPVATRLLNPEDYGKASISLLFVGLVSVIAVFGVDQSFIRFFYEKSEARKRSFFQNSLVVVVAVTILVTAVIAVAPALTVQAFVGFADVDTGLMLLILVFSVFYRMLSVLIRMQQRAILFSNIEILNKTLNLVFVIVFAFTPVSRYQVLLYAFLISQVILTSVMVYATRQFVFADLSARWWSDFLSDAKEVLSYGVPLLVSVLVFWFIQSLDKVLLQKFASFYDLGVYSAAFRVVSLLTIFQTTISNFWTPVALEHFQAHPEDREFHARTAEMVFVGMFTVAIVTVLLRGVVVLLLGDRFADAASLIPFLVFVPLMFALSEVTSKGIAFQKESYLNVVVSVASLVVCLLLDFVFIPPFGSKGAAIAVALSFCGYFWIRTIVSVRCYPVDYRLWKVGIVSGLLLVYAAVETFLGPGWWGWGLGTALLLLVLGLYHASVVRCFKIAQRLWGKFLTVKMGDLK